MDGVLKDEDFIGVDGNLCMTPMNKDILESSFRKDIEFFEKNNIIDYSMLLLVIDLNACTDQERQDALANYRVYQEDHNSKYPNLAYLFGVIDYFQLYTFNKAMERFMKRCMKCDQNLETSSQPPGYYARRYLKFVDKIVVDEYLRNSEKEGNLSEMVEIKG